MKPNLFCSFSIAVLFIFTFSQRIIAQQSLNGKRVKEIIETQQATFQTIFTQPEVAIKRIDSLINIDRNWPDTLRVNNLKTKGVYYAVINELDSALVYFNKGLNMLSIKDNDYLNLVYNISDIYKKNNNYDAAFQIINDGLKLAEEQNDLTALGMLYGAKASCYSRLQLYSYAIENQNRSIEFLERTGKGIQVLAIERHNLANLYMLSGEHQKAKELFTAVIPEIKAVNRLETFYLAHLNLSKCHIYLNQLDTAEELISFAQKGLESFKNANLFSYAEELTFEILLKRGLWSDLSEQFEVLLFEKDSNNERLLNLGNQYINALLDNEDQAAAIQVIERLLEHLKDQDKNYGIKDEIEFYQLASKHVASDEDFIYRNLTRAQATYIQYTEDVRNKQLKLAFESSLLQKEKQVLEKNIEVAKKQSIISTLVAVLSMLLFCILIGVVYQQRKQKRKELKYVSDQKLRLEEKIAMEAEINKLKAEEIENRKTETISLTMDRAKLRAKIKKIIDELDTKQRAKLSKSIKDLTEGDQYWKMIQDKFMTLNPEFVEKLKERCPQITSSQLQFCSLIKMYLDNREMAFLLNITPESVVSKKYRLKKKFNLKPDEDITSFIQSL